MFGWYVILNETVRNHWLEVFGIRKARISPAANAPIAPGAAKPASGMEMQAIKATTSQSGTAENVDEITSADP